MMSHRFAGQRKPSSKRESSYAGEGRATISEAQRGCVPRGVRERFTSCGPVSLPLCVVEVHIRKVHLVATTSFIQASLSSSPYDEG